MKAETGRPQTTKYRLNSDKAAGFYISEMENVERREGRALPSGTVVDSAHITLLLCSIHPV